MNGNSGIQPTVELATTNGAYPYVPYAYGNNGNGFFGSDGIWTLVLLALLFGGNGFGNGFGNNGWNNVATTDFVSSEFTQRDISQLATQVGNGFQNTNNLISSGFADAAQNLCNVRSDILTGNMSLSNQILDSKYANAIGDCNTQRDILNQTNQLAMQAATNALNNQAHIDNCCCEIERLIRQDGDETRALITQNTIQDLRDKLAAANDVISDERTTNNVINSLRPYPVPAYLTASPYQSIYNGFGWNNGFYGNGFFGNTIV